MAENFYTPFSLGTKVYDIRKGNKTTGKVMQVAESRKYCIKVLFSDDTAESYTADGKSYEEDAVPSLYTHPVRITLLNQ